MFQLFLRLQSPGPARVVDDYFALHRPGLRRFVCFVMSADQIDQRFPVTANCHLLSLKDSLYELA